LLFAVRLLTKRAWHRESILAATHAEVCFQSRDANDSKKYGAERDLVEDELHQRSVLA